MQGVSAVSAARVFPLLSLVVLLLGCDSGAPNAQRALLAERVGRVKDLLREDRHKHRIGVAKAAEECTRGFGVSDPVRREAGFRNVLVGLREPPRVIGELLSSPMSFMVAIDREGIVIARNTAAEHDQLKGMDFAEFPSVASALTDGIVTYGIGEFESLEEGGESSYSMLFTAPAFEGGEVSGGVVIGIPLWREAQRLSRQLRVENAALLDRNGLILWVYLYRGDQLFHFDTPPELDGVVPDGNARRAGLERSPGGFTGELLLHGKDYGYAVVPLPAIGEDIGMVIFQSEDGSCADDGDCSRGQSCVEHSCAID